MGHYKDLICYRGEEEEEEEEKRVRSMHWNGNTCSQSIFKCSKPFAFIEVDSSYC